MVGMSGEPIPAFNSNETNDNTNSNSNSNSSPNANSIEITNTSTMGPNPTANTDTTHAPVPSTGGLFKKRGGTKRKEFRPPAASLATRSDHPTDTVNQGASTHTSIVEPLPALSEAPAVIMDAKEDAADSDEDKEIDASFGPSSASALVAQAAEVDTSDPESSSDEESGSKGGIVRPSKRAKTSTNPLVQSTRDRLKKTDHKLNIESNRSAVRDTSTVEHRITQVVEPTTVVRDPKKPKWSGPQKPQANNVRMISRFDYQPDVCKDYKETGRCGYGDSCKFLHDRGDYKQGWELERDWNAEQEKKRKRALLGLPADEDEDESKKKDGTSSSADDESSLPWACLICRQPFKNPVVTRCNHYYCEDCALQHYVKDTKCFACKAQTLGIFNTATKLIAVLKQRASSGFDPRAAIEKLEQQRLAEKEAAQAQSEKWIMPGRTAGL